MTRHFRVWSGPATVLVALLGATAAPAAGPGVVGGTLDLAKPGGERSAVVARNRAAALALLPGRPGLAAVGKPGAGHAAGRVRIVQLAAGEIATTSSSAIAGPGRGARAGAALAAVRRAFAGRDAALLIGAPEAHVRRRGRPGVAFLVADPARTRKLTTGGSDVVTILGARDRAQAGASVAQVPDADGDGRRELLIGCPGEDGVGRPSAGAAYVVFSRGLSRGDTVDLADPTAALRIAGPAAGAAAGSAVAGSVDARGDGRGDAVVGAPLLRGGSGAAYLVDLTPGRPVDLAAPDSPAVGWLGADGERAGAAVAAGEFDGDGVRYVAIGAPRARVQGRGRTGAVYVVAPGPGERTVSLAGAPVRMEGETEGDRAGSVLVAAGQAFRGDEPDLVVGAKRADALGHRSAGAVYLVSGLAVVDGVDLALLGRRGVRLVLSANGAAAGSALASAADPDRNGRNDLLVGMPANDPGPAKPSVVLRAAPVFPPPADFETECDAAPVAMVLDTSGALAVADPRGLRGNALELLLRQPSARGRAIGAFEAAPMPAEAIAPLVQGRVTSGPKAAILAGLVDEAIGTVTGPGDLRVAVDAASSRLPSAPLRSAIVVAGGDAFSTPDPDPVLRTDVIGLGVTPGSPRESMLRGLATASGGRYRRANVDQVQARVAKFDAKRRCEKLVHGQVDQIGGRRTTALQGEEEFAASATITDGTGYADVVLSSSSPAVTVEPYDVTLTNLESGVETTFSQADVNRAVDGAEVADDVGNGISLVGAETDTSVALRVGLQDDDQPELARAAYHHPYRWRIRYGSEPRRGAVASQAGALYTQFFAPRLRGPTP